MRTEDSFDIAIVLMTACVELTSRSIPASSGKK